MHNIGPQSKNGIGEHYYYWRRNVMFFNFADDTSILCKNRDYDSAYNDLLSAASTMIH